MKFVKELFSESGDVSMIRVMSLLCCLSAVGIAIHGINRNVIDYEGLSFLCGTFLSAAFAGKILQKNKEINKIEK